MSSERGNFGKNFAITLDMAKSLAMKADTKIGHDIREYFIAAEKKLIEGSRMMTIWEYAKVNNIRLMPGETSDKSILAKTLCREHKIGFAQEYNEKFGFINAFPVFIIQQAFEI
jgi:hypothetical protein